MNEFNIERPRRVVFGSLATSLGNLITIFGRILLVPLFLKVWGNQLYGEWLTLYAAVGYMTMIDFGMQMYVINRLNQCYSTKKMYEYTRVFHSGLLVSLIVFASAIIIVAIALSITPLEKWFHFTLTSHSLAIIVAFLLALQIIARMPYAIISGLYRTIGEFPRGAMIANFQHLSFFVLTALTLILGGGIVSVALIQLVPLISFTIYVFRDIHLRYPEIQFGFKPSSLKVSFSFLGPSLFFSDTSFYWSSFKWKYSFNRCNIGANSCYHFCYFANTGELNEANSSGD